MKKPNDRAWSNLFRHTRIAALPILLFTFHHPAPTQAESRSHKLTSRSFDDSLASGQYMPGRPFSLAVGAEAYREKTNAFQGIEGVHLNLDYLFGASKNNGITLRPDLLKVAKKKLRRAHLKSYTQEELESIPGQPELIVYPAFSKNRFSTPAEEIAAAQTDPRNICGCPTTKYWASFIQGGNTLIQPLSNFRISTWGMGDQTEQCTGAGEWMENAILQMVDQFALDYQASRNAAPAKLETQTETPKMMPIDECNQIWSIYVESFETGSANISLAAIPALDHFIDLARRCQSQVYQIETHADLRASESFNDLLTKQRADAIKRYLKKRGVPANRIKTMPFGERNPISMGKSEADHAANRRIVIRPVKHSP